MKNLLKQIGPVRRTNAMQKGFTLIELMIVVVIIGVLVKIAVPAYTAFVTKSNRTDAKTALLDLATREEKYYSLANTYTDQFTLLYSSATTTPFYVGSGGTSYYTLTIAYTPATPASGTTASVPASYIATATANSAAGATTQGGLITSTAQNNDPCGALTITNTGVTGNTGTQTSGCW